jgi:soluble lytic murein transglycosylase-like protein
MSILKSAILAIALFFSMVFPAQAETTPTKAAVVKMISKENNKLQAKDITRIVNAVFTETKKHNIDPLFMLSLIRHESRYNPRARSRAGALGLTQVIPRWHRDKIRGRNIMNIETNIEVGTQVLADCLESNKGYIRKAVKCYSSNAKNYQAFLKAGYIKIKEADVIYRFENELPLAEKEAIFEMPQPISTSLNTEQALAPQDQLLASRIH